MKLPVTLSDEGLTILLLHGVVDSCPYAVRNYTHKHVTKDAFARLLKGLAGAGCALSMDGVIDHHRSCRPFPPRAFAVTFDDGFENNYSIAAPILADLNIPAAFYVTTGFIEHNRMSWIDRLEYCLETAQAGALRLPWDESPRRFVGTQDRVALLEHLRFRVKRDANIDVEALVSDVFRQCGVREIECSDEPVDKKMSWPQAAELNNHPLFVVGGHTHGHRVLGLLPRVELESEIRTSVELCRRRIGLALRHYSYPEGMPYSYSPEVIRALKRHGIVCCPTAEEGINHQGTDLFRLKRCGVVPAAFTVPPGYVSSCVA